MLSVAIQTTVLVLPPETVVLKNVQDSSHLTEYEHARALLFNPREQLVQHHHLATVLDKMEVRGVGGT